MACACLGTSLFANLKVQLRLIVVCQKTLSSFAGSVFCLYELKGLELGENLLANFP